ncbi:MAG: hypothetical protein ABIK94_01790 [candidate division WOR-3 bacterium]
MIHPSFSILFIFSQFFSAYFLPLPRKDFYHCQFLNIRGDKEKEIVLFTKNGEMIITDLSGKILSTHHFPKRVINSYVYSNSCYLVSEDGIYHLSFDNFQPKVEKILNEKIISSFSVSPFHFAIIQPTGSSFYHLTERGMRELFSFPLSEVHSASWKGQKFYLAESSGIYEFELPSGRWEKNLTLKGEKILAVFNLNDTIYYLKRRGVDLFLVRYQRKKSSPIPGIPIIGQRGKVVIKVLSPFLLCQMEKDLYLIYPSGFKVPCCQLEIKDLSLSDINGDGLLDFALLQPEGLKIFYNERREFLLKKEKMLSLFSLLTKKRDWEEGERVFLVANLLNDQLWSEEKTIGQLRRTFVTAYYWQRVLRAFSLLLLISLPIIFALLLLKKSGQKRKLGKRDVPEIVTLASEVVTLDHNFVVKGNFPAALRKLDEIFKRYRLPPGNSLPQIWDEKEYKSFLAKFLSSPHLHLLTKFVEGRILEIGQSWDCVAIDPLAADVLLFLDKTIEGVFSHIFSDHFRYAQSFSQIKISYLHPTDWARKVKFSFYSDAQSEPNLKEGHLAEDLQMLAFRYPNYFAYGGGKEEYEKLWVTFLDLVGIIKGIIAR